MSLRTRVALMLAAVMLGPLLAAWFAIGHLVPQVSASQTASAATHGATSMTALLVERCRSVGDTATIAALEASRAVTGGELSRAAAAQAVRAAAARHPRLVVALLDARGGLLAQDGDTPVATGATPPARSLLGSSCSSGGRQTLTGPDGVLPTVGEVVPVLGADHRLLASAVVWYPLDQVNLSRLALEAGVDGRVSLLDATAPTRVLVSSRDDDGSLASDLAPVLAALPRAGSGASSGRVGATAYTLAPAGARMPFRVLVTSRGGGAGSGLLLGVVATAFAVGALVLLVWLASRMVRPLDQLAEAADKLRSGDLTARSGITGRHEVGRLAESFDAMATDLADKITELRAQQAALHRSFAQFGEALGRTHDLDGLLHTVLEAVMLGSGAVVATSVLADDDGVSDRVSCVADGARAEVSSALDPLRRLAIQAMARRAPVHDGALDVVGPALAVPLRRGEEVVGALAVARAQDAPLFDPAASEAVQSLAVQAGTAVANVRAHEENRRLSVTDPLTGAGNFRALTTTMAREVERAHRFGRPLSLLMLDLDHFKAVNDSLGHGFGDAVLQQFAARLAGCLREVDTVARYGGEEFAVLLPETDQAGATLVAERIVELVRSAPFSHDGRQRTVTVSVGVATVPAHARGQNELMRHADGALYEAKRAGRNRWWLASAGTASATAR